MGLVEITASLVKSLVDGVTVPRLTGVLSPVIWGTEQCIITPNGFTVFKQA